MRLRPPSKAQPLHFPSGNRTLPKSSPSTQNLSEPTRQIHFSPASPIGLPPILTQSTKATASTATCSPQFHPPTRARTYTTQPTSPHLEEAWELKCYTTSLMLWNLPVPRTAFIIFRLSPRLNLKLKTISPCFGLASESIVLPSGI